MCRPHAAGVLMEPLEGRRLLSAAPTAPIDSLDLPGALLLPGGIIVTPGTAPAAAPGSTEGFYSTTVPHGGKPDSSVMWNPAPTAARSGGAPAAASSVTYPPFAIVNGYCGGAERYDRTGFFRLGLKASCGSGAEDAFAPSGGLTINYSLPPAASSPATPNVDYNGPLLAGHATIPEGFSYAFVPYTVVQDRYIEGAENVKLQLQGGSGYYLGANGGPATNAIQDMPYWVVAQSEAFTIGFTDSVPIAVRDADNFPPVAATVMVKSYDGTIIQPQQQSVSTDADGNAMLAVKGIGEGLSSLVLQLAQNPAITGTSSQEAKHAQPLPYPVEGYPGQTKKVKVLVLDANNKPMSNVELIASVTGGTKNDHIFILNDGEDGSIKTNENGEAEVEVVLKKHTDAGNPEKLTVMLKNDVLAVGSGDVTVKQINITVTKTVTVSANENSPNNRVDIVATATDAAGNGVEGVPLFGHIVGGSTAAGIVSSLNNTTFSTDAAGRLLFTITGLHQALQASTARVEAGNDDTSFDDCAVTVTI